MRESVFRRGIGDPQYGLSSQKQLHVPLVHVHVSGLLGFMTF